MITDKPIHLEEYLTGGFDEVTAVRVAYDTPLPFLEDRLRLRVAGDYSSFDAEDELGFFLPDDILVKSLFYLFGLEDGEFEVCRLFL